MTIGHIDAGSSAAMTHATGELVEMLLEIQNNQVSAAQKMAEAQASTAHAAAQCTISAGEKAADSIKMDMYSSIAGTVASSADLVTNVKSSSDSHTAHTEYQTGYNRLNATEQKLGSLANNPSVNSHAAAPAHAEELKAKLAKTKASVLENKEINDGLEDADFKLLTSDETKDLKSSIEAGKKELQTQYDAKTSQIEKTTQRSGFTTKILTNVCDIGFKGQQSADARDKAQQEAASQLMQSASSTMDRSFQATLDQRNNITNEIAQIINATRDANAASTSYRG
jgi:hypothetical protein